MVRFIGPIFFCIDATLLGTTLQCLASKKHLLVLTDT